MFIHLLCFVVLLELCMPTFLATIINMGQLYIDIKKNQFKDILPEAIYLLLFTNLYIYVVWLEMYCMFIPLSLVLP